MESEHPQSDQGAPRTPDAPPPQAAATDPALVAAAARAHDPLAEFSGELSVSIDRATAIATQLGSIIRERELSVRIGSGEHLRVEAWQTCAAFAGVSARTDWTKPEYNPVTGEYEGTLARVSVVRIATGQVIAAGEAGCYADEIHPLQGGGYRCRWVGTCNSHDSPPAEPCPRPTKHAIVSMAQTRATSKALSRVLGWIPVLEGYSSTPAEDLEGTDMESNARQGGGGSKPAPGARKQMSDAQAGVVFKRARAAGEEQDPQVHGFQVVATYLKLGGLEPIPRGAKMTEAKTHLRKVLDASMVDRMLQAIDNYPAEPQEFSLRLPTAEDAMKASARNEGTRDEERGEQSAPSGNEPPPPSDEDAPPAEKAAAKTGKLF